MKLLFRVCAAFLFGAVVGFLVCSRFTVLQASATVRGRPLAVFMKLDRLTGRTWFTYAGSIDQFDYFSAGDWIPLATRFPEENQTSAIQSPVNATNNTAIGASVSSGPHTNKLDLEPVLDLQPVQTSEPPQPAR